MVWPSTLLAVILVGAAMVKGSGIFALLAICLSFIINNRIKWDLLVLPLLLT